MAGQTALACLTLAAFFVAEINCGDIPWYKLALGKKKGMECQVCLGYFRGQAELIYQQGNKEAVNLRDAIFTSYLTFAEAVIRESETDKEAIDDALNPYDQQRRTMVLKQYHDMAQNGTFCNSPDICPGDQLEKYRSQLDTPARFGKGLINENGEVVESGMSKHRGFWKDGLKKAGKAGWNMICKTCRMASFAFIRVLFAYTNFAVPMIGDWCGLLNFNLGNKFSVKSCIVSAGKHSINVPALISKLFFYTPLKLCKLVLMCPKSARYSIGELVSVMSAELSTIAGLYAGDDDAIYEDILAFEQHLLTVKSKVQLHEFLQPKYTPGSDDHAPAALSTADYKLLEQQTREAARNAEENLMLLSEQEGVNAAAPAYT